MDDPTVLRSKWTKAVDTMLGTAIFLWVAYIGAVYQASGRDHSIAETGALLAVIGSMALSVLSVPLLIFATATAPRKRTAFPLHTFALIIIVLILWVITSTVSSWAGLHRI